MQLLKVIFTAVDERGESDRRQVANGNFIGGTILDDFGTQVGRLDCTQVLLVGFR